MLGQKQLHPTALGLVDLRHEQMICKVSTAQGAHEMILEMVAWNDPNLVPIKAFYEADIKVNFCGKLATDPIAQVRSGANTPPLSCGASYGSDSLFCCMPVPCARLRNDRHQQCPLVWHQQCCRQQDPRLA